MSGDNLTYCWDSSGQDPELENVYPVDADFDSAIGGRSLDDNRSTYTTTTSIEEAMHRLRTRHGRRALDIGTGTGSWAIEFADEHPECMIIGTDISPIQPSWVPVNCSFQIEDAQQDWGFPTDFFDYIHVRHMTGCIDDWRKLYAQALKTLTPGSYIEHVEYDIQMRSNSVPGGELPPEHIFKRWYNHFVQAGRLTGRSFEFPVLDQGMPKLLKETGFEDVTHRTWKVPIGSWAADKNLKELGLFTLDFLDNSLEGFALLLFKDVLKINHGQFMDMVEEMRAAWADQKRLQPYFILTEKFGIAKRFDATMHMNATTRYDTTTADGI
ncbi:hypothetical protein TD95_005353 [Thielaviopsis punctulata]|uniref:Methyltransferase domain-containing protein n=1 Tax=Thielaviopsis punctulata TaxID=72032 RepID=A0A0F4ZG58_9PEZI|nr:hypothetical protein TD95_005353 [Thielaviopsis punctulata]